MFSGTIFRVPDDGYEPLPGAEGKSVAPAIESSSPVAAAADSNVTMPVYAVAEKSKNSSKPPTRNLSDLYAKVSKPKKSGDKNEELTIPNEQASANQTMECGPQVEYCSDAVLQDQQSDGAYDVIKTTNEVVPRNRSVSDYDNVAISDVDTAPLAATKENVYEDIVSVMVDISHL